MRIYLKAAILEYLFLPALSLAAYGNCTESIVPSCGGVGGNPCCLQELIGPNGLVQNLFNFILFCLSVPLAAIAIAWAGALLFLPYFSSSDKARGDAKEILWAAVIGLILALAAWIIVNTIITTLTGRGLSS